MSLRNALILPLTLLLGAPLGCGGSEVKDTDGTDGTLDDTGDDTDTDTDDDDDDVTSTVTIDAQLLTVLAVFAYDETTNRVVPYEDPNYGPQPIQISVIIADTSAQVSGFTASNSCTITLSTNTPQPLVDVTDLGAWWGFEMPADADVSSDCFVELPKEFGGDPEFHVAKWSWGFTVSELDATVAQQLEAQLGTQWPGAEPYVIGGGTFTPSLEDVLNDDGYLIGYGQAFAADANFAFEVDPTGYAVQLNADDVWDGKAPARGVYAMGTSTVGPASLITR